MALSPEAQAALNAAGLGWLAPELQEVWVNGWAETGDPEQATNIMRADPTYETYYPGNLNPNGTPQLEEGQYEAMIISYQNTVEEAGLDPGLWTREDYARLIGGSVWADEFQSRVNAITVGVRNRSEDIRQYYANAYGIPVTDAEMIASVMDPALGDALLSERIRIAEIGGAAAEKGFGIDMGLADRLENSGFDYTQAEALFRQAGVSLPLLDRLSRRHQDPNDSFNLENYLDAAAFGTPEAVMQVRRMSAAETSMFRSARDAFINRQSGSVTGLVDR